MGVRGREGNDEASNMLGMMHCVGYLNGMTDSAVLLGVVHPEARLFGPPKTGISLDQARLVFIKWANTGLH